MVLCGAMSNEQALFEKTKKGDKEAFGEIYRLFVQRIFRFIYYMVKDREHAEDLSQNTFVKLWRNISLYDSKRGSPSTFIFTIAKNLVFDEARKTKTVKLEQLGETADHTDLIEGYKKVEARDEVKKFLRHLESEERELLILRFFEEMSFAEIAEIFKIRETAVRVRVHRILQKLKKVTGL